MFVGRIPKSRGGEGREAAFSRIKNCQMRMRGRPFIHSFMIRSPESVVLGRSATERKEGGRERLEILGNECAALRR